MDGNNQNNMDNFIPKEIPIPGVDGQAGNPYHHNPYQTEESGGGTCSSQQNTDTSGSQPYLQGNMNGQAGQPYPPQGNMDGQPYPPQGNRNGFAGQPYPPQGNKKGSSTRLIIGVVCGFAVILAVGLGIAGYLRSRPAYKIAKGFQNLGMEIGQTKNPLLEKIGYEELLLMMGEDGSHVDSSLDFSMDVPMFGTTTFGVDTDCYKDMHAKELNADTSISMMNYDFAHLNIYADEEVFCFSLPELFMEDMYIDNENVVSQFNQSILSEGGYTDDLEDFSINLFPDGQGEGTALDIWRNYEDIYERFEDDLKACKDGMKIEKAGKGLYRVVIPAKETNRLLQDVAESYKDVYGMQEDMELLMGCEEVISTDISFLFEINGRNRIESIILENPVEAFDQGGTLRAEIFFLGEKRSIDKIQGKISATAYDDVTREIICQIQQTDTGSDYQFDMDMKMVEDEDTVYRMKFDADCDAAQDWFGITFAMLDDVDDFEVDVEGNITDIVKGQSLEVDLSKMAFMMDGEELFKITGDIMIEPLRDEVERTVKAETAFFEMTWEDWFTIIEKLDDAYGSILDSLW